jgi:tetratricopeptide (TPR) repeat protein
VDIREFSYQISQLKKANQFQQALGYFKEHKNNFTNEQIATNNFLIADIIASLRKTNNAKAVGHFLATYKIEINRTTSSNVLIQYGWAVYDNLKELLANNHYDKSSIISLLKHPLDVLSNANTNSTTSILGNIMRVVFQKEKEKQNQDHNFLNRFLDLINPNALDRQEQSFEKNGKAIKSASDFESWYAHKSKHLLELGRYEECFKISHIAIEQISSFHGNNDLWFARRMALSKQAMGNTEDAIKDLEKVFNKKRDWFIQKEIAELYFSINLIDKAFKNAMEAMKQNGFGKIEFKIGLIVLLGKILKTQGNSKLANEHFWFVRLIREKNGWSIPSELQSELNNIQPPILLQYNELFSQLKGFWQPSHDNTQHSDELKNGTITKILNDNEKGKDGFLESKGISYYFSIPSNIKFASELANGVNVGFVDITKDGEKKRAKIVKILK